jgi:hypothetical protein
MVFAGAFGFYQVMTALGLSLMTAAAAFLIPMLYVENENKNQNDNADDSPPSLWRRIAKRTSPFALGIFFFLMIFAISDAIIVAAQGDDIEAYTPWPHSLAPATNFWQLMVRFLFISGKGNDFFQNIAYPMFPWVGKFFSSDTIIILNVIGVNYCAIAC